MVICQATHWVNQMSTNHGKQRLFRGELRRGPVKYRWNIEKKGEPWLTHNIYIEIDASTGGGKEHTPLQEIIQILYHVGLSKMVGTPNIAI